jgi:hypothetical protein
MSRWKCKRLCVSAWRFDWTNLDPRLWQPRYCLDHYHIVRLAPRATQGRFIEHRAWMIRSFALTFAAVTLRLYLPLHLLFQVHFDDAYRAISFLCWVPNLLVAELYLRKKQLRLEAGVAPEEQNVYSPQ